MRIKNLENEKFEEFAKLLREKYHFDIKENKGILKSEGREAYKPALKIAIGDLFAYIDKDKLVFAGRKQRHNNEEFVIGRSYWCMLNIGTSVCKKNDKNKTLQFTGMRNCRLGAISNDKKTAIVFPYTHRIAQDKTILSEWSGSPQIISVSQIMTKIDEKTDTSNLMAYFDGFKEKFGQQFSFKASDFTVKNLIFEKVAGNIIRPTFLTWEKKIEKYDSKENYPYIEEFKNFLMQDVSGFITDKQLLERLNQHDERVTNNLLSYILLKDEITRYMNGIDNLLDYLYSMYEEIMVQNEKTNKKVSTLNQEQVELMLEFVDEYYEAIRKFFTASSHGFITKNQKIKDARDLTLTIGGVYENVDVGISIVEAERPSGIQKVLVLGIEPNTLDILCYKMEGDRILSNVPMILKPINFMTKDIKEVAYFDTTGEIQRLIKSEFTPNKEELKNYVDFPIFKGKIKNKWDDEFTTKYAEFLYKQAYPDRYVSQVYAKGKRAYYCSNVDGDEGNEGDRYIKIPPLGDSASVIINGNFCDELTCGHYKNLLYHNLCDIEDATRFAVNRSIYKNNDRAGYCEEILRAMGLAPKDGVNIIPIILDLFSGVKSKKTIDNAKLNSLFENLEFVGGTQNEVYDYGMAR